MFVAAEDEDTKSPRARTQTPVFSAAPYNNNEAEMSSRNERVSVATPSTADLYSVMNLKTKTEHLAEEYVEIKNIIVFADLTVGILRSTTRQTRRRGHVVSKYLNKEKIICI